MAKNIQIYTGPIYKLCIENIVLDRNYVDVKKEEKEILEKGKYYQVIGGYINMEYGCVLPNYEEAEIYLNSSISMKKELIRSVLLNENITPERKEEFINYISNLSSCVFYKPSELKHEYEITKKEYKQYIKEMKNKK